LVSPVLQAASTLTEQQIKEVGGSADGLTWFQWSDLGPDKRPSLAVKYSNWGVTYASLCDALRQQQPDGLFGFSQGATAAALFLAALQTAQRQGRDLDVPLPKFCVVVRGCMKHNTCDSSSTNIGRLLVEDGQRRRSVGRHMVHRGLLQRTKIDEESPAVLHNASIGCITPQHTLF
jgi:7-keto-8-aminopelargonate synthetase-like enzyme